MASNTVEQIFVELLLNAKGYNKDANEAIKKSDQLEGNLKGVEGQSKNTNKSLLELGAGLRKVLKGIAGLTAAIAAGTGLLKLAEEARKANDELNFLSQNLGMSAQNLKAWQGAAGALGGSAQGMTNDMKSLNSAMNDFKTTGESSLLPVFAALGVSMTDAKGDLKDVDSMMLDLSDSMSKMNREQAVLLGNKLGFDEGTINTLLQGRDAMKQMVDYHKQMYSSNKQDLENSRKLSENQAKMSAHWASMKLMLGNAVIPLLIKLSEVALKFFEYLQKHQKTVKNVFEGLAIFLGAMIIPSLLRAVPLLLAFFAPFAPMIAIVGSLAAAFTLLYDDYKTWAEGGKSLFNWGAFREYIDKSTLSVDNLKNAFKNLSNDMLSGVIPTMRGYIDIMNKVLSGDFKGASAAAWDMVKNAGKRALGIADDLTGNKQGAAAEAAGNLVNPSGGAAPSAPKTKHGKTLQLSDQDIIDIMKVASTEVVGSLKGENFNKQAAGVVDTILNRAASGKFGGGVRDVVNQRWAFSDINSNQKTAYGSVQNVPMSRVSKRMESFVRDYIAKRAAGLESSIGTDINYVNPNALDPKNTSANTRKWVSEVISQAKQSGQIFGAGKSIHYHGTPSADRNKMPSLFNVALAGSAYPAISQGAMNAQAVAPAGQASVPVSSVNNQKSSMTNIDVNVAGINVNTTASTVLGTVTDAMKAVSNSVTQLIQPMR